MKDHSECKRGFFRVDTYRPSEVARLVLGFYHPDGGTTGEFGITWMRTTGNSATPEIRVFNDAWSALHGFSDFLAKLAEHDGEDLTPEAVIDLLKECGVEDINEEE